MSRVTLSGDQWLIDGEPQVLLAGEIHYFRVPRDEWGQRLDLLVEAGCNAVAAYLPWLLHELPDGSIDVTGATRPDRDIGAFIDLCAERGLWFIARPGPFIMAELMNEGLPYRLYREHPEIVPVGWDATATPSRTVDYLQPAFLAETARWFDHVLPVIADRLIDNGGNVIALQLDNEIGMLAWVTNSPDLTPHLLADFRTWLRSSVESVQTTAPVEPVETSYPVDLDDDATWADAVRSPREEWAAQLRLDLHRFMRDRFARYAHALRELAQARGITGVPFVINIHGTDAGSAESFPLGISQLVQTYAGIAGMVSGSDHYVGEMTLTATTDLYVLNAFSAAVHAGDQPLTSVEFEAGSGDYGGGMDLNYEPATVELKTRLFLAQGNRLINYYLFAGGHNRPLDAPVGNGADRISFTGERHGTAAPVGPEGQRGQSFAATARAGRATSTMAPWLAAMSLETDDLQLGLVLDAYATEYHYPGSAVMSAIAEDLKRHRGAGPRRALARSALLGGYRFDAVWLERDDPRPGSVLMLSTGQHMDTAVQQRVADFVTGGGRLLLLGRLPRLDLTGQPCTILADALGLAPVGEMDWGADQHFPTVLAGDWAAPWPATRVGWLERLDPGSGTVVLTDNDAAPCGVEVTVGAGRAVVLSAELPSSLELFGRVLARLGVRPGLSMTSSVPGVFVMSTASTDGQRLLHLLNVTGHTPEVLIGATTTPDQAPSTVPDLGLPESRTLRLPPRSGVMLPLGLVTEHGVIESADAELVEVAPGLLRFGPGLAGDSSGLRWRGLRPGVQGGEVNGEGETWTITGPGPITLAFD